MNHSVLALPVLLLSAGLLATCASDPRKSLTEQTGIVSCDSASVRAVRSEQGDVFRFEISADRRTCAPPLMQSIVEASQGTCRSLLKKQGACAYSFRKRTVGVEESKDRSGGVDRYAVRSW